MPRIELTTEIPATLEQCFELSLSVDAHRSSMSASSERAIAGVTSGVMRLGNPGPFGGGGTRDAADRNPGAVRDRPDVRDSPPPLA